MRPRRRRRSVGATGSATTGDLRAAGRCSAFQDARAPCADTSMQGTTAIAALLDFKTAGVVDDGRGCAPIPIERWAPLRAA